MTPRYVLLLAMACTTVLSPALRAADLSMLTDFGRPDIPVGRLGLLAPANSVGVEQLGDANALWVEQSGTHNNAQVWQAGVDLRAHVTQVGADNELRLLQADGRSTGELQQSGAGNQMAITQQGLDNVVTGSQVGLSNDLVLQQVGASQFGFNQIGDRNQIVVDAPVGLSLQVDQVGNDLRFQMTPAP